MKSYLGRYLGLALLVAASGCSRGPTYEQALATLNSQAQALTKLEQQRAALVAQYERQLAELRAPLDQRLAGYQRQQTPLVAKRRELALAASDQAQRQQRLESATQAKMLAVPDNSREALFAAVKKVDGGEALTERERELLKDFAGPSYRLAALAPFIKAAQQQAHDASRSDEQRAAARAQLMELQAAREQATAEQVQDAAIQAQQRRLELEEQVTGDELARIAGQMREVNWDKAIAEKKLQAARLRELVPLDEKILDLRAAIEETHTLKDSRQNGS